MLIDHNHQTVNAISAAGVPVIAVSMWGNIPQEIPLVAGVLGIIWYVWIFSEKIAHYYTRWKRQHKD